MSAFRDNVVDDHRVFLPLPPESCIQLLVQLQRPGKSEPDDGATSILQIQTMTRRCRVDQCKWDLSSVPVIDVLCRINAPGIFEPSLDTLEVVLIPVRHQKGLAVCSFYQIFQGIQLSVMDGLTFLSSPYTAPFAI